MRLSAVKNAVRRLKGLWLALRLSRLTPDQISEWMDSDEHGAQLDALMPPDPADANTDRPQWRKRGAPRN